MNMTERIDAILRMLVKSPDDVFLHFSLGMEYVAAGRFDEAQAAFEKCSSLDTDYLPARVELGKTLRSAGRLDQARRAFTAAAELAKKLGEQHVCDFLAVQLASLGPGD